VQATASDLKNIASSHGSHLYQAQLRKNHEVKPLMANAHQTIALKAFCTFCQPVAAWPGFLGPCDRKWNT